MTDSISAAITKALRDWALMYPIPAWGLAQGEQAERLADNWAKVASGMVVEALNSASGQPGPTAPAGSVTASMPAWAQQVQIADQAMTRAEEHRRIALDRRCPVVDSGGAQCTADVHAGPVRALLGHLRRRQGHRDGPLHGLFDVERAVLRPAGRRPWRRLEGPDRLCRAGPSHRAGEDPMTVDIPDELVTYLSGRDQQRSDRVAAFRATLPADDHAMIRQCAVQGFDLGWLHGASIADQFWREDVPFPHDREIVADVVERVDPPVDLEQLQPRQLWLFQEAAVMGFVLGVRSGGVDTRAGRAQEPTDPDGVLAAVVAHCQSTSDLYPVIGEDVRALIRKIVKPHQPIGGQRVAGVVALLSGLDADLVAVEIRDMVDDGLLVEVDGGLRVAS